MRKALAWSAVVVALYCVAWLITYALVMEGDFQYTLDYFQWGWTGGGDLPTTINAIALACVVVSLVTVAIAAAIHAGIRRFGPYRARQAFALLASTTLATVAVLSLARAISYDVARAGLGLLAFIAVIGKFVERRARRSLAGTAG